MEVGRGKEDGAAVIAGEKEEKAYVEEVEGSGEKEVAPEVWRRRGWSRSCGGVLEREESKGGCVKRSKEVKSKGDRKG